jgi:predicted DNA-binding transcriptional regulator AlpA
MQNVLDRILRKSEVQKLSGHKNTEFHRAIQEGRHPGPDVFLGPRMPGWFESTIIRHQAAERAKPKPAHNGFQAKRDAGRLA